MRNTFNRGLTIDSGGGEDKGNRGSEVVGANDAAVDVWDARSMNVDTAGNRRDGCPELAESIGVSEAAVPDGVADARLAIG